MGLSSCHWDKSLLYSTWRESRAAEVVARSEMDAGVLRERRRRAQTELAMAAVGGAQNYRLRPSVQSDESK